MRKKKIRGHKRRWKEIEAWIDSYKNHDIGYLTRFDRDYAKIRVHPWSGISLTESQIPEPKGETKKRILKGLIQIYDSWKNTLEQLGEPY